MKRTIISFILTVLLLFVLPLQAGVFAYEENQELGSIQIIMKSKQGAAIEGAEITLYQIANLDHTDGQFTYIPTQDFSSSGIPLPVNMTADENIKTATALISYITNSKITANSSLVDKDGNAIFTGLTPGLYLIRQTGSVYGYRDIISFLVSLPITDADGRETLYDLTVVPKVLGILDADRKPTPTPIPTPADGSRDGSDDVSDDNNTGVLPVNRLPQTGMLVWPIILLAVAGMVLISIGWADANLRRKDK